MKNDIFNRNKELRIPIGISGSLKSTLRPAKHLIVSRDDERFSLYDFLKTGIDFIDHLEPIITQITNYKFVLLLNTGYNIYIDATNLTPEHRAFYIQKALEKTYSIHFLYFLDFEKAIEFNAKRERKVPAEVIERQINELTFLTKFERNIASSIHIYDYDKEEFIEIPKDMKLPFEAIK